MQLFSRQFSLLSGLISKRFRVCQEHFARVSWWRRWMWWRHDYRYNRSWCFPANAIYIATAWWIISARKFLNHSVTSQWPSLSCCYRCGPTGSLIPDSQRFKGTMVSAILEFRLHNLMKFDSLSFFQDAFVKISRSEGVKSLWSGLAPTLVLALPTTVLYFVAYEQFRLHLKDMHMKYLNITDPDAYLMPMTIPLIAGCSARCFAVTIVNPLELIRTKVQSERMSYSDVGRAFKLMVSQYGIRGLFKGLLPTIIRDAPFSSIYWTSYETFKRINGITQPVLLESFIGGAISGGLAAFITCPFDVIKTHQQIEFGEKFIYSANGKKKQMTSMLQTMRNILRNSGFTGFYAGLTPRLLKVVTACAVMISTYEVGKSFFYTHNVKKYYAEHPVASNGAQWIVQHFSSVIFQ